MINKVILLGRLGKDPILRNTASGVPVATFSVATSESYKGDDGQWQEKTDWHNIVVWRDKADYVSKILKKGSLVYIEGKITTRTYEQEGQTKYITEVVANVIKGLEKRESVPPPSDADMPTSSSHNRSQMTNAEVPDNLGSTDVDDLPF